MKTAVQKETSRNDLTQGAHQNLFVTPQVSIVESPNGYLLTAEMPGVSKDGLEVTLEGSELAIIGRRNVEKSSGELLFRESHLADYRRVFELDPSIDAGRISAKMEQGVLALQLPKAERVKPRKIEVTD